MNVTQQGVIALLKSAVTGKPQQLPAEFDLDSAFKCAQTHLMTALVYEGAVLCGVDPKLPVMQKMFQIYCRMMQISERQMAQFARICQAFDEAHIDYMPLKGCLMKELYRKPELRTMGDIDILIRVDQYDKIKPIMKNLGFEQGEESDHELIWDEHNVRVELHKRLVPSYDRDYFAYYGDGWQLAKEKDGTCYAMTKEDQMVYLLTHFAKHFRGGGVGCRHVVDIWICCRVFPELNKSYIEAELDKLQLKRFYDNVLRLLDWWFADGGENLVIDEMTDYIFDSGSWGKKENRFTATTIRETKQSWLPISSRMLYLWRIAFPCASVIQDKYKVLQKAPWLLPLVWLIRPFHKVLFDRKTFTDRKKEYQMLSRDSLRQRELFLSQVGLGYHF